MYVQVVTVLFSETPASWGRELEVGCWAGMTNWDHRTRPCLLLVFSVMAVPPQWQSRWRWLRGPCSIFPGHLEKEGYQPAVEAGDCVGLPKLLFTLWLQTTNLVALSLFPHLWAGTDGCIWSLWQNVGMRWSQIIARGLHAQKEQGGELLLFSLCLGSGVVVSSIQLENVIWRIWIWKLDMALWG